MQVTARHLDPALAGRTILVGCYPSAQFWWVDQLPVLRRSFIYTDQGVIDVPDCAPVSFEVAA